MHTFERNTDLSTSYETTGGAECVKLVKAISPVCVSSLDLLPGFIDLNVLVAMARDVEDVFQSIADSGGTFERKFDDSMTMTANQCQSKLKSKYGFIY